MIGKFKKAVIALTMSATLAGLAASPAEAQRYYRGRHHGVSTGTAVGIGLLGLGLGIAASQGGYRGGYYYDYPPPRYYAPVRRYYRHCWQERFWDNYYGGWVIRNVCR